MGTTNITYDLSCEKKLVSSPEISIVVLAYNHETYIRQAIDSIIMQNISCDYEIIIGEDCSSDRTREICFDYQRRYSDKIRVLWSDINISKNDSKNFLRCFQACRGKYVAICDGDDYWTDPRKLQKQLDYMNGHPGCVLCFHPVKVQYDSDENIEETIPAKPENFVTCPPTFTSLLKTNFIQTNSVLYRWDKNAIKLDDFPSEVLPCDWLLHLLIAKNGSIGFLNETMSIYRKHHNSIWYNAWKTEMWYESFGWRAALFYKAIQDRFGVSRRIILLPLVLASLGAMSQFPDKNQYQISHCLACYRPATIWLVFAPVIFFGLSILQIFIRQFSTRTFRWRIICRHRNKIRKLLLQ